jgi:hypothetical protein
MGATFVDRLHRNRNLLIPPANQQLDLSTGDFLRFILEPIQRVNIQRLRCIVECELRTQITKGGNGSTMRSPAVVSAVADLPGEPFVVGDQQHRLDAHEHGKHRGK